MKRTWKWIGGFAVAVGSFALVADVDAGILRPGVRRRPASYQTTTTYRSTATMPAATASAPLAAAPLALAAPSAPAPTVRATRPATTTVARRRGLLGRRRNVAMTTPAVTTSAPMTVRGQTPDILSPAR